MTQTALRNVIEPIFENIFAEHSYGFRPGRGAKDALRRVDCLLKAGKNWVVDADLKGYFDSIPQGKLVEAVKEHIADGAVLRLIESFLKQGVMESGQGWKPTEAGTPQGAVISPLLANLYLNPLDHLMAEAGFAMTRYADDFVILCRSREEADRALAKVKQWVEDNGLTLHPTKTKVVDSQVEGFDFLGYTFRGGLRLPRKKSLDKLKDSIRAKTKRTNGCSLTRIAGVLSLTLQGWFGYFKHCHGNVFTSVDSWVRGRLRSIPRQRKGGRGRGRGSDHQRWPNTYFAEHGLFSLTAAHVRLHQSLTGP